MPRRQIPHRPPSGTRYEPESLIRALRSLPNFADELVGFEFESPLRAWTHFGGLRPQQIPLELNAWMSRDNWRQLAVTAGWICIEQRTNINAMYSSDVVIYPPNAAIEDAWAACVQLVHEQHFEVDLRGAVLFSHQRRERQAVYINRRGYRVVGEGAETYLLGYAYHISAESLRFDDGSRVTIAPDGRLLINALGSQLRQAYAHITGLGYDASSWSSPELSPTQRVTVPPSPDTLSDTLRRDSGPVRDQGSLGSAASFSLAEAARLRALERQSLRSWRPDLTTLDESDPLDALDAAERSGTAELRASGTGRLSRRGDLARLFEPGDTVSYHMGDASRRERLRESRESLREYTDGFLTALEPER